MASEVARVPALKFHPLTPQRWPDLELLLGERGAADGCWCMWWRVTRAKFETQKGARNRQAMKDIVASGETPGVLAYADNQPIGWCAVAPRDVYGSLNRSRTLKRVDDEPVWSITCFFVARPFRGRGVTASLLNAAVEHAGKRGARIIEGYPIDASNKLPSSWEAYLGSPAVFQEAGFVEIVRRSVRQPIMRYTIENEQGKHE